MKMTKFHVLIVNKGRIPVRKYGGTQRVIWYLGKELAAMGHKVSYLVGDGSKCDFGAVGVYDPNLSLNSQIPDNIDLVHLHFPVKETLSKPYLITLHGNTRTEWEVNNLNTTFVSRNHAARYGSKVYVFNGLGFEDYGKPLFNINRQYVHFLGRAAWKVKNLRGAIDIARESNNKLRVLGGHRINLNMGFKVYPDRHVRFEGMVGGEKKNRLINGSKALIFPVTISETMGLASVESLYFGCPVFATPYGALPDIVTPEFGFLSDKKSEIVEALDHVDQYDRVKCHEYACDNFSSRQMAENYLSLYEKVMNGQILNKVPPRLKVLEDFDNLPFYD